MIVVVPFVRTSDSLEPAFLTIRTYYAACFLSERSKGKEKPKTERAKRAVPSTIAPTPPKHLLEALVQTDSGTKEGSDSYSKEEIAKLWAAYEQKLDGSKSTAPRDAELENRLSSLLNQPEKEEKETIISFEGFEALLKNNMVSSAPGEVLPAMKEIREFVVRDSRVTARATQHERRKTETKTSGKTKGRPMSEKSSNVFKVTRNGKTVAVKYRIPPRKKVRALVIQPFIVHFPQWSSGVDAGVLVKGQGAATHAKRLHSARHLLKARGRHSAVAGSPCQSVILCPC